MFNTIEMNTMRWDGGVMSRTPATKAAATVVPPLAPRPATEADQPAKTGSEAGEKREEKVPVENGILEGKQEKRTPDPLDEVVTQALTRMRALQQATEQFLLGAVTLMPESQDTDALGKPEPHENHGQTRIDTLV